MEFCKNCIEGNCTSHKWFTELKLENENDILIAELNHILEYHIIENIVEKVFLVESHLDYTSMYNIGFISGEINFNVNVPTSALKDGYYIPVRSYSGTDNVINHQIEVIVSIIRHNPMSLKVRKNIFSDELLHKVQLIDSFDYLHMESMEDYPKIVKLSKTRLEKYIDEIKNQTVHKNKD